MKKLLILAILSISMMSCTTSDNKSSPMENDCNLKVSMYGDSFKYDLELPNVSGSIDLETYIPPFATYTDSNPLIINKTFTSGGLDLKFKFQNQNNYDVVYHIGWKTPYLDNLLQSNTYIVPALKTREFIISGTSSDFSTQILNE